MISNPYQIDSEQVQKNKETLVNRLEVLLVSEKIGKDIKKTDEELRKIIKLSECLGVR